MKFDVLAMLIFWFVFYFILFHLVMLVAALAVTVVCMSACVRACVCRCVFGCILTLLRPLSQFWRTLGGNLLVFACITFCSVHTIWFSINDNDDGIVKVKISVNRDNVCYFCAPMYGVAWGDYCDNNVSLNTLTVVDAWLVHSFIWMLRTLCTNWNLCCGHSTLFL